MGREIAVGFGDTVTVKVIRPEPEPVAQDDEPLITQEDEANVQAC
jgi:hypothetical protein